MSDAIGSNGCEICMGRRKLLVGMSFPPNSTIGMKAEYDACPGCTKPPHTFHAKRTAQILQEMRSRSKRNPGSSGCRG